MILYDSRNTRSGTIVTRHAQFDTGDLGKHQNKTHDYQTVKRTGG